jgi:glycosyltransferase involved in cell wall biosynthesis
MESLDNLVVALPSGAGFGWGNCGDQLTKRLVSMGAEKYQPSGLYGIDLHEGNDLVQAISGPELTYTANAIGSCCQIGYGFVESDIIAERYDPIAKRLWDFIISGSSWMAGNMADLGWDENVVIQGVDTSIFHYNGYKPSPFKNDDSFVIGSFGKFEYRKAQDVVIKAVKLFQLRHKDVKLITAWGNPWPQTMLSMNQAKDSMIGEVSETQDFDALLAREGLIPGSWKGYNGSNSPDMMALLYRSCDVALFPNRCEAGQSLMLQEALACGTPAIAANATGMADLVGREDYPCKNLALNGGYDYVANLSGVDVGNWVKPCLEEVVDKLERAYVNRDELQRSRKSIAEFGGQFTWDKSAEQMVKAIYGD